MSIVDRLVCATEGHVANAADGSDDERPCDRCGALIRPKYSVDLLQDGARYDVEWVEVDEGLCQHRRWAYECDEADALGGRWRRFRCDEPGCDERLYEPAAEEA